MQFIFENDRTPAQQSIFDSAVRQAWKVSDIFSATAHSDFGSESTRRVWGPVLTSLAFGEATALQGFGGRISAAERLSVKSWLIMQLRDEAKHTEGFTQLLKYLYPSHRGDYGQWLASRREVALFYGTTHKAETMLEWMICTQIIEVFGKHCYTALLGVMRDDPAAAQFLKFVLADESRHIRYLGSLIDQETERLKWGDWRRAAALAEKMVGISRSIFENRRQGSLFHSLHAMGIDASAFCEAAAREIERSDFRRPGRSGSFLPEDERVSAVTP